MFQSQPPEYQEDILRLITNQYSRDIINTIQKKPKSAIQISKETGTELSMVYRRLHKLEKYKLLKTSFQVTDDGKKSYYYQSKINGVNATYQKGDFKVMLSFNHR